MGRLLLKLIYLVILIRIHYTEAAGLFHGYADDSYRCVRFTLLMILEHLCIVHFINMVPGEYEQVFRIIVIDKVDILGDGIRSSFIYIKLRISLFPRCNGKYTGVPGIKAPISALGYIRA